MSCEEFQVVLLNFLYFYGWQRYASIEKNKNEKPRKWKPNFKLHNFTALHYRWLKWRKWIMRLVLTVGQCCVTYWFIGGHIRDHGYIILITVLGVSAGGRAMHRRRSRRHWEPRETEQHSQGLHTWLTGTHTQNITHNTHVRNSWARLANSFPSQRQSYCGGYSNAWCVSVYGWGYINTMLYKRRNVHTISPLPWGLFSMQVWK